MNTTQRLREFIDTERLRFEDRHNNMIALSFGEVLTYYQFLTIIEERYKNIEQEYTENIKMKREILKSNTGTSSSAVPLIELYNQGVHLHTLLRLEAESFYIFAKIALDKIVHAIELYFGQGRGLPLDSHDNFKRHINEFARQKRLDLPGGYVALIEKLKKDISDFRDYQIEHQKSPRTIRPVLYDDVSGLKMVIAKIYPTSNEAGQIEMEHIDELRREIEEHIENTIGLIEVNRDKTALTLEDRNRAHQG